MGGVSSYDNLLVLQEREKVAKKVTMSSAGHTRQPGRQPKLPRQGVLDGVPETQRMELHETRAAWYYFGSEFTPIEDRNGRLFLSL